MKTLFLAGAPLSLYSESDLCDMGYEVSKVSYLEHDGHMFVYGDSVRLRPIPHKDFAEFNASIHNWSIYIFNILSYRDGCDVEDHVLTLNGHHWCDDIARSVQFSVSPLWILPVTL